MICRGLGLEEEASDYILKIVLQTQDDAIKEAAKQMVNTPAMLVLDIDYLLNIGELEKAKEKLIRAKIRRGKGPQLQWLHSKILKEEKKYEEAIKVYKEIIKKDLYNGIDEFNIRVDLGWCLGYLKKYAESLEVHKITYEKLEANELRCSNGQMTWLIAQIGWNLGFLEETEESLKYLLESERRGGFGGGEEWLLCLIAEKYTELNKLEKAEEYFDKAYIGYGHSQSWIKSIYGNFLLKSERYEESLKALYEAEEMSDEEDTIENTYFYLSAVLNILGDNEKALNYLNRARDIIETTKGNLGRKVTLEELNVLEGKIRR